MSTQPKINHRTMLQRVVAMVREILADPEVGHKALFYFVSMCVFLLLLSGLNVVNSYVGRDFMTAIADRNLPGFWRYALLTLIVFAALTLISVIHRYVEESLGMLWRKWLTARVLRRYADHRVYWRMVGNAAIDNPDQRIAEDIRSFTTTTLSFVLMLLSGGLTVIAFSGVLWTISPVLFMVAIAYAMAGTWFTFRLGRPLIKLNYDQSDKEANFRASLIHVRENADSLALSRREDLWIFRLTHYLNELIDNTRNIIGFNRRVGFFTTGYSWLIQLIPALFIAPLYIDGKVEFGVITQATMAFTQLLGAFSLIITQFQSISSFAAVVTRLAVLTDHCCHEEDAEIAEATWTRQLPSNEITYRGVTLLDEKSKKPLLLSLTVDWRPGESVRVFGADGSARDALFRVTSGIRAIDQGQLFRPPLEQVLFVTERPYLPPGTLRELFLKPHPERLDDGHGPLDAQALAMPESRIRSSLKTLGLGRLVQRSGGLDVSRDWDSSLSLEEQQLLVIARALACRPQFIFLDRPETSLPPAAIDRVMQALKEQNMTHITFAKDDADGQPDIGRLELITGGKWRWQAGNNGQPT